MSQRRIGLDLGTTNSAIAVHDAGRVQLARFDTADGWTETFRSILYFRAGEKPVGGPRSIEIYIGCDWFWVILYSIL